MKIWFQNRRMKQKVFTQFSLFCSILTHCFQSNIQLQRRSKFLTSFFTWQVLSFLDRWDFRTLEFRMLRIPNVKNSERRLYSVVYWKLLFYEHSFNKFIYLSETHQRRLDSSRTVEPITNQFIADHDEWIPLTRQQRKQPRFELKLAFTSVKI